uniref:Uncharacterized protein n=1 Tax=Rhizophora mucronata TaxID=61149 RepID=A0A2P2N979_RHIMU
MPFQYVILLFWGWWVLVATGSQ